MCEIDQQIYKNYKFVTPTRYIIQSPEETIQLSTMGVIMNEFKDATAAKRKSH